MAKTTWCMSLAALLGLGALEACTGDDTEPRATPDAGPEAPGNGPDAAAATDGAVEAGAADGCVVDPTSETFGLTDSTKLVSIVRDEPTSRLPRNARANSGRLFVDACGVRVLAELGGSHSIHTWVARQTFTATSTTSIDSIESIRAFRKVGPDFAVVATTRDNKTYLYRMPGGGGAITKVVSAPLINGDFGAQSIGVSSTYLFFSTYKSGPTYELRRAPISSFASGTIPLEEPLATDSSDAVRDPIFLWGNLVSFGFKHYAQDCTPSAGAGCTADATIAATPHPRYRFAGQNDSLFGWMDGKLLVHTKSSTTTIETTPAGITTTISDALVAASVSPDGSRIALVTRSPAQGFRLHRISNANTKTPSGISLDIASVDNVQDVWTNGKVALVMWARSDETKPLAVQGVAWP